MSTGLILGLLTWTVLFVFGALFKAIQGQGDNGN